MELSVEFVSSQPPEENSAKWSYEIVAVEAAATTAGKAKVKPFTVLFDQLDFGNARARAKVIELFEKVWCYCLVQLKCKIIFVDVSFAVFSASSGFLSCGSGCCCSYDGRDGSKERHARLLHDGRARHEIEQRKRGISAPVFAPQVSHRRI
jgi:hypothetical protein